MKKRTPTLLLLLIAISVFSTAIIPLQAQTPTAEPFTVEISSEENIDPNMNISFPPPVYAVSGEFSVIGTVNVPNMSSYFIEFRPLRTDLTMDEASEIPWAPASLPTNDPVTDEVLGVWNTRLTPDGLYELRLTVNVTGEAARFHVVTPLRVDNTNSPSIAVGGATPTPITIQRATPTPLGRSTLPPTPTAFTGDPTVTALTDANVRTGDSVDYDVVGFLLTGESAKIIGRSSTGSGWWYIQLSNGRRGFISPGIVSVQGNTGSVSLINPPPTPTPTFTPTPPSTGDVLISGDDLIPDNPRCGEQFKVHANITNAGSRTFSSGGSVLLQNVHIGSGTVTTTASGSFPILAPGENFVVVFDITVSQFPGEDHRIILTADSLNQILEEDEDNNVRTIEYRLRQGSCP